MIVLKRRIYNNKMGMIAERVKKPVPVWQQGIKRNFEVNFSLKHVDWVKSKEVFIRNNFVHNFLEAAGGGCWGVGDFYFIGMSVFFIIPIELYFIKLSF